MDVHKFLNQILTWIIAINYSIRSIGVGFKTSMHKSSAEIDGLYITDPQGNTIHGKIKDDISVFSPGPKVGTRLFNGSKENAFIVNLALGYLAIKMRQYGVILLLYQEARLD